MSKTATFTYARDTGTFTLALPTGADAFPNPTGTTLNESESLLETDKLELAGSNLVTIDSKVPRLASPAAITGVVYSSNLKKPVRGIGGRANSIQVNFVDDGKFGTERSTDLGGPDRAGSGIDASSVTPGAFNVSGNTVNSVQVVGNSVYLTLAENLASDAKPRIVIANASIMDKAGNVYPGGTIREADDGLGPIFSLSEDKDLSNEKVTVTIATDEQLATSPTVKLSRVIDAASGSVLNTNAVQCVYAEVAASGDDPALPELVRSAKDGATTCPTPANTADIDNRYQAGSVRAHPDRPGGEGTLSQTAGLTYGYAVTAATANPTGKNGGKYNVYVTGRDTQNAENTGRVGHVSDANNSAAFTFQLDTVLNGAMNPKVTVSDKVIVDEKGVQETDAKKLEVEAVDPMIVTVDFAGEAGEYPGDSYRTVKLTSASLKVTFAGGASETTNFDLTTQVSSPDSIKFTIPLLSPKVGSYQLTVKAEDSAGNNRRDGSGTAQSLVSNWKVVSPKPVDIALVPGWNLVSLPFQPANPAINSVIGANHPADIVMTYDNANQVWLVSRRDAESGLFTGDIAVMTASTAYFIRTNNFQAIKVLRPALATAAAAPPPPPVIKVVQGFNLVPVVSNDIPTPKTILATTYFGDLKAGSGAGWLKALSFDTLRRTWDSVTPTDTTATVTVGKGYWLYSTVDGVIIP